LAVNVLGHAAPEVRDAAVAQLDRLVHTSNMYYTEPMVEAARLLVESAFPSRVFWCNSGAEANEAAIKIARKWGQRHRNGAYRIICFDGAFHGRTLATIAATGRYLDSFTPAVEGFVHVPFGDLDAVEGSINGDVVAVMLEPIQGESGVIPMPDDALRQVRQLCDRHNVLLILDEIQTGMGRTGRMWAHQHAGITPDVMTVAKGLAGGLPIGACLAAPRADVLEPGDHGSTFGGNAVATAAAIAVLGTVKDRDLAGNAARVGERLVAGLRRLIDEGLPVAEVRGRGLMLAVVLTQDIAQDVLVAARERGLIVNAIGQRVIRLLPPLILTTEQADLAVARLREALQAVVAAPRP
jgi:predicted acetylornithine/succinylornithine family transaminase